LDRLLNLLIRSCGIYFDGAGLYGIDDFVCFCLIIIAVNVIVMEAVNLFGD
jgi:hypothetical protein